MNTPLKKAREQELNLSTQVVDDSENDNTTPVVRYEITSYGADYDVAGFVARLQRDDIIIPSFQRDYVWRLPEASRFVESILLGLPVPGVFLAKDFDTNKLLVIDGQQRLKTLQFFIEGVFNSKPGDKNQKVFKLGKVSKRFEGLTFGELSDSDRRNLNDYVIHATIIKQDKPSNDDTSISRAHQKKLNGDSSRFGASSSLGSLCLCACCRIVGKRSGNFLFGFCKPQCTKASCQLCRSSNCENTKSKNKKIYRNCAVV